MDNFMSYMMGDEVVECFICKLATSNVANINKTVTNYSKTPILRILQRIGCLADSVDIFEEMCFNCLDKINDYDYAYETANQIQSELIALRNKSNLKQAIKAEEIEDESNFDSIEMVEVGTIKCMDYSTSDEHSEPRNKLVEMEILPLEIKSESEDLPWKKLKKSISRVEDVQVQAVVLNDQKKLKPRKSGRQKITNKDERKLVKVHPKRNIDIDTAAIGTSSKPEGEVADALIGKPTGEISPADLPSIKLKKRINIRMEDVPPINLNTQKKIHKCTYEGCLFETSFKKDLIAHAKQTGHLILHCEVCGKLYKNPSGLFLHRAIHTGLKKFQCETCGRQFGIPSSLRAHQLTHSDLRLSSCSICHMSFRGTSHLNNHMKTHTGEKSHECPTCGKKFTARSNMIVHYKAHQGIKHDPVKCCPICPRTFQRIGKLNQHLVKDHNITSPFDKKD